MTCPRSLWNQREELEFTLESLAFRCHSNRRWRKKRDEEKGDIPLASRLLGVFALSWRSTEVGEDTAASAEKGGPGGAHMVLTLPRLWDQPR